MAIKTVPKIELDEKKHLISMEDMYHVITNSKYCMTPIVQSLNVTTLLLFVASGTLEAVT
jgi:hypothetical protein